VRSVGIGVLFSTATRKVACGGAGNGAPAAPRAAAAAKGTPATAIKAAVKKFALTLRIPPSDFGESAGAANPNPGILPLSLVNER
jgi:hypothetical protein